MNQTQREICLSNLGYDTAFYISYIIWYVSGFLLTTFGIFGNVFVIMIMLNKTNRKDSISAYWIAIAICETIFLVGIFWLLCVGISIIKIDPREILSCGIFYSCLIGPTILSNLYLASMSIDRTFMILYPTRYRLIITQRHVRIRIFSILFVVIVFMIPHHFYFYYDSKTTIFICEFREIFDRWRIRTWPFMHAIIFVSLPSIITCISAAVLLRNRSIHRKLHQHKINEMAYRMERNSKVIFSISIGMLFFLLPAVILQIFIIHDLRFYHSNPCPKRWKTYRILVYWFWILSVFTYSCKFYLRLVISKTFRQDIFLLIYCIRRKTQNNNEQNSIPLKNRFTGNDSGTKIGNDTI